VRDVRIVAIKMQQLLKNGAYVQTTKCQNLVNLASLAATIIEDELKLVAPFLSISRHQKSSTK